MKRSWIMIAILLAIGILIGRTVFSFTATKVKGQIINNHPDCLQNSRLICTMSIKDGDNNIHSIEYGGNFMAGGMACHSWIWKSLSKGRVKKDIYTSKIGDMIEVYGRKFSLEKFIPDESNISLCGSLLYYIKRI